MGFFLAWAIGEGIIVYRWAKSGAPPTPGALALPSALFFGLSLAAAYQPARGAATALAFGLDVAVLLKIVGNEPKQLTGWPPAMIDNPAMILPGNTVSTTAELTAYDASTAAGTPAGGTGAAATGTPSAGITLE